MKIKNLLVGSDPEFFLIKGNMPQSAVGLIGGSKTNPKAIGNGCHVLEDNVMVEFNTPPALKSSDLVESVNYVMDYVLKHISDQLGNDIQISNKSSLVFPDNQLNNKQAREFGCDPDYNVWNESMNATPDANMNNRYAGGHIHLGFDKGESFLDDAINMVKYLDFTVGIPSVVLDKGTERRALYGKAGTFRIKSYGVEYRSPSNYWIFSEERINDMYRRVQHAVDLYESGFDIEELREEILNTINNSDVEVAKSLCEKYKLL